jgi:hypothetical protein
VSGALLTSLNMIDYVGFAASAATLLAFAQRRMMPVRVSAIAANIFFIAYGAMGPFYPVLVLNLVLLPLSLVRFAESVSLTRIGDAARARRKTLLEDWRCRGRSEQVRSSRLHGPPVSARR